MEYKDLQELVAGYLQHYRTKDARYDAAVSRITAMTFLSGPEEQWAMILEALRQAGNDEELAHIAAGPIEGFLGKHGKDYIERVERQASSNPTFARTLTGVWKYMMPDDVWARIQVLQSRVTNPLARS